MKLLLNWVYFCMVYSLTHQVTHQNPFGSQVFEDINSPKLSASALPLRKVRKFENVPERRKVRAQQPDNRVSPRFAHHNDNAKRSELKPHLMHTNDKTKLDQPHPEHDHNALWGYKELEHHILKGPTDPPPPSNHTDTTTKQPSLQDLEQHFSSTIRPEHLSFYKWLYKSLDNGRINWYDKVIESLANVNFDPPHLDDVTTEFPVPERHRYLYLYLKQLQHYAKNPTTPHTTRFEEDNLRKKLIAYFGKSFSAEYNKFYKWLYDVIHNVDAAKRRLQFATEQSITAADFDRLVKSTPFQIPTKYRRYFVMVNELERRMSSTNHHYWHTTTPDIYAESSVELSYLREDKRTSIAREEYWQRRYERYYHFTPKPEYEQFYRWFFKENHQLNFPERMKGPVPKVIPMYINPKRDDVTIPSTPFKIPILYTVLFAWLDDKKVNNISTTLIPYPDLSLDFTSDWVDSTEEPSTAPTTKYPLITMDPALKEKCESLFHSTIQPWYEQFFSWMWGVNHDESGFYRRNEAYKTYSDFDYSAEMERTLFPIPEHQREYFGYVHAIERILSSTGHHFKLGMTTPMPPQTSTPKTTIERVETTTQETTTTKKPRTYPNGSLIPDWEKREMLDQIHLEDEIMNFFNMEIEPKHEPYYRWRYLHEMDANRTREKMKIAQNLHDLDFTKLFRYTPFSIPDYHEYQFAQIREAHRHLKAREYPLRNAELTNKLKRYFLIDIPPKYLLFYDWLRDLHTDLKAYYDIVQIGKSLGQINYTQFLQHTPFPIPVVHLKYYAFIKAAEREQYERKMKDLSKEYSTRKMKPERRRRRRRRSIEESPEAYEGYCALPIPQEIFLSVMKPSHNNTIQSECSTLGIWSNQSFSCKAKYLSCPADWYSQWIESTSVSLHDVIGLACDGYQAITEPTDYTMMDITQSTLTIDKIRYDKFNEAFYKMRHSLHEHRETYEGDSALRMHNNRWIEDDQSKDGSFNFESDATEEITTKYKRVKRDIGQYTSATPLHRTVEDDKHMIKKLEHYFSTKIPSLYLQFYHWLYETQQDEEGFARRLSGFSSLKNQTYNEDNELLYELLNTPFPIPADQQEYFAFVRRMERYVQSTAHHNKVYVGASTKTAPTTSSFGDSKVSDITLPTRSRTTPSSIKVDPHGYTSSTPLTKEFLENYFHIKISPQYHKYYEWLYEMQQNKDALLLRISAASQIRKNVDINSILIRTPFPIPEAERSYYAFVQECDRILKSTAHHAKWWGSSTPLVQTRSAFSRTNTPSFENYSHERAGYQQEFESTTAPATPSRLTFHLGRLLKNLTTADERTSRVSSSISASRATTETTVPTPQQPHTLIGLKELHEYFTTKIGPYAEFYQWLYELEQDKQGYKNRLKGAKLIHENPSLMDYTKLLKNTPFAIPDNQKQYFAYIYGMDQIIKSTNRYVKWFRTTSTTTEKTTLPNLQTPSKTSGIITSIPASRVTTETTVPTPQQPHTLIGLKELHEYFTTKIGPYAEFYQWLYELEQDKQGYKNRLKGAKLVRENPSLLNYTKLLQNTPFAIPDNQKQYFAYIYGMDQIIKSTNRYVKWFRTTSTTTEKTTPARQQTSSTYVSPRIISSTTTSLGTSFTSTTNRRTIATSFGTKSDNIISNVQPSISGTRNPYYRTISTTRPKFDYRVKQFTRYSPVYAATDFRRYRTPYRTYNRTRYEYRSRPTIRPSTIYTTPDYEKYSKYRTTYYPWIINFTRETNETLKQKLDAYFTTTIIPKYLDYYLWRYKLIHGLITPIMKELDPIVLANVDFQIHLNNTKFPIPDEGRQIYGYHEVMKRPETITRPLVKGYMKLAKSVATRNYTYPTNDDDIDYYIDYPLTSEDPFSTTQPYDTIDPEEMKKLQSYFSTTIEPAYGEFHKWLYNVQEHEEDISKRFKVAANLSKEYLADFTYSTPFRVPEIHTAHFIYVNKIEEYMKSTDHHFWRKRSSFASKPTTARPSLPTRRGSIYTMFREKDFHRSNILTKQVKPSVVASRSYYRAAPPTYRKQYNWLHNVDKSFKESDERRRISEIPKLTTLSYRQRITIPTTLRKPPTIYRYRTIASTRTPSTPTTLSSRKESSQSDTSTIPEYKEFEEWVRKIQADPKGVEEREQFVDDVLDANITVLRSRTPFPIPSNEINYFVIVNELERLRRLHPSRITTTTTTTTTTTQSTPTHPQNCSAPVYKPFYRWLSEIEADPKGVEERGKFVDYLLDANMTVLRSRTPFPIPIHEINYFVFINELERLRRLHAQTTTTTTTTQSTPTHPHTKNSAPAYKPFYRWLRKIEADDEGFEDRERFVEMIDTNLTVLQSRTPFPIPSNHINFFAYVNELERLRNSTNYIEYTTHAPIYHIKRKYDHHATALKKQDYHAPALKHLFSEKFRTHTTTLKTTYDKDFENKVDKYFPFTYSPEYRSFYRWLYRMRHEHDIPLHPKVVQKIAHPNHKFQTPFPIPKDRLYEYAYIEYLRKHNFQSPSADITTKLKPDHKLDQLKKAKEYFNFSWEPRYDEFYIWFYTMIHKESLKDKTCGKILSTPNFEQPYLSSTPFPIPPEYHTHYAMMQYMDNLDSKSNPESQYSDVSDYQVADASLERQKRQVSYNDINEAQHNEHVEKKNVRRKRHTSKTDNNDENLDEIISRRLNDSKIAPRYHLFYKWLRRQLNSNLRPKILSKDPRILRKIDDDLIKKYSKITNSSIPFSDLKYYLYIKLLREEQHTNLSSGLTTRIGSLLDDPFKVSFPDYSIEKLKEWWYINKYPNDVDPIYDHFYEWWLAKYHCKRPNTPRWDGPDEISPSYNFTTAKTAFYRIPPKFTHRFAWLHDPIKPNIDFPQTARDLLEKYGVNDSNSDEGPKTTPKEFWEYLLDHKKAEKKHDPIYEEFYQWFYKKHYKHPNPFEERGGTTKMEPRLFDELQFTTYRTYKTMKDTPFRIPLEHTDIVKWIADEDFPSTTGTTTLTTPISEQKRIITKIPTRTTYAPITYRTLGPSVTNKYQLFYSWLDKRFLDAPSSYQKAKIPLVAKSDLEPGKEFKPPKTTPFKIPQDFTNLVEWIDEQQFESEFQKKPSSLDKHSSATENHLEPLNEFVRNHPNPAMNQNVSSPKEPTKTSHKLVKRSAPKYKKSIEKLRKRNERSINMEENKCPCSNRRNKRSIHYLQNKKIFLTRWKTLISKSVSFFIPLIQLSIPIIDAAQKCYSKRITIYESDSATQVFDFNMYARIQMNLPWIMYSYLAYIYNQNIHGISASPTKVWSTPVPELSSCTPSTPVIVFPKNSHQFCYDADSYKNLIIQSQNAGYDRENMLQNNAMYEEIAWKRRLQEDAAMDKALDRIFTMSPTIPPESIETDTSLCTSITPLVSTTEKSHQVYYDVDNYKRLINQVQNAKEHHDEAPQHNYMYENAPWRHMFQEDVAIYRALNRIFTSRSTNKTTPLFTTSQTHTIPKHEENSKKQLDAYFSTNINPEFYQAYKWFYNVRIDKEGYLKRRKTPKPLQIDFNDVLKTSPFPLPFHLRHYYAEIREIERAIKSTSHHIPFTRALPTLLDQISFIFTDSSRTTITESYSAVRRKRHLTTVSNTPYPYTKYEVEVKTPRTFLKPRSHTTISHEVIDSKELYPIDTEELKKFTGTYRRTTAQYTVPFYPTIPLDDPMVYEKLKHFFKFEIEPYYVKFYMWLYRLLTQDEGSVNLDQADTDSLAPGSRSENDHIQVTNTPFPIPTQYRKVFARIYGEALRKANMSTRAVYTSTYKQTGSTTPKTLPTTVTLHTVGEAKASPSTQETQSRSRKTYNYVTRPRMNWVKGIWVEHLTEGFFDPEFIRRREEYLDQQNAAQRYMTAAKSSGSKSTEESFQDPNDDLTLPIITQRTSITANPTSNKQQDNDPPSVEIQNDSDEVNVRKKRNLQTGGENFNLSQFSEPPDWLKTISESSSIESPEESSNDDITLPVLTQKTSIKTSHSTKGPNDDSSSIEHESDSEEILSRKKRAATFSMPEKELTSTTEESSPTTEENSYYDVTHAFDNTKFRRKRAATFSTHENKLTMTTEESSSTTEENSYYDVTHAFDNTKFRRKRAATSSTPEIKLTTTEEPPSTTEENSYYDVTHAFDNTNLRRKRAAIALSALTIEPIYDITQWFDDGKSRRKREARLSREKAPPKYAHEDDEDSENETDFYGGDDDDESKDSNDLSSISLANAGNSRKYHVNSLKKLSNIPLNSQFRSKNRLVPRHLYPRFLNKISPLSSILNPLYDPDYIKQEKRIRRSVDSKTSPISLEISLEKFSTVNPRLKPTGIPQTEQIQLEATEINIKTRKGKGGSIKKGKQISSTLSPSAELFSEVDYFINCTQTMDDYDPFVGDLSDNFFEITNTFAPDDPIIKGDYFDISESKSRKRRSVKNPDSSSDYSSSESTSEREPDPNDSDRKFESKFNSYSKPDSNNSNGKFQSKFKSPSTHSDSDDSNRRLESKFKHYKFKPKDDSSENSESKFSLDPHKLAKVIFNNPGRKAVLDLSLKDLRKFSDNVTEPSLEDSDPHLRSKYKQPPYSDESECLQVKHEKAHKTKHYSRNLDGSESRFSLSDAKLAKVIFNNPGRKAVLNLSLKDLRKFSDNITESFSEDSDPHLRSKYKKPPYSDELGLKTTLKPSTTENSQDTEDSNRHFRSKFKMPPYSEDESVLKKKPDPEKSESSDSSDS